MLYLCYITNKTDNNESSWSFFGTGDAVRMIFKLGYVPEESEFYELTCDQYKYYFEIYGHTDEKLRYAASLLPSIFSKDTPYSRDVEP